jgi:hypothetical protein
MDNSREWISADTDYFSDDSASGEHSVFSYDDREHFSNSDTFDQMEMMEIEMTFSGGKKDSIVVLWGDDPKDLATVCGQYNNTVQIFVTVTAVIYMYCADIPSYYNCSYYILITFCYVVMNVVMLPEICYKTQFKDQCYWKHCESYPHYHR